MKSWETVERLGAHIQLLVAGFLLEDSDHRRGGFLRAGCRGVRSQVDPE
jgi:hypothetical protein